MTSRWLKQGLLYCLPEGGLHPKLCSHAANPVPVYLGADVFRVFFSSRDSSNRSSVGAVDIDIETRDIVAEYRQPLVEHGEPGTFFQDGVSLGNLYEVSNTSYVTFMGWQKLPTGLWRGNIGRLRVTPDAFLELESNTPLLSVDDLDPLSLSYPWVIKIEEGRYDMWYGSTATWDSGNGEMLHPLKMATSIDGNTFCKTSYQVPSILGVAQAFSRPTILARRPDRWDMWFSFRGSKRVPYRIGHATSEDGIAWFLSINDSGIDVSPTGWDSEMVEYPYVFEHRGKTFMLYNGNGYGKSGFGLAVFAI